MDDEPTAGEGADPAASGGETAGEDTGDESAGDESAGDDPAGDETVAGTGDDIAREAAADDAEASGESDADGEVPADVRKYERFTKMDGSQYDRVNEFLRDRTYITARE